MVSLLGACRTEISGRPMQELVVRIIIDVMELERIPRWPDYSISLPTSASR